MMEKPSPLYPEEEKPIQQLPSPEKWSRNLFGGSTHSWPEQ
jgi:hypothetical protein